MNSLPPCIAALLALLLKSSHAQSCLQGAISPDLRKNVTNAKGESFPLGAVLQPYTSSKLAHAVYETVITEVLGYNLDFDPHSPPSSVDALYAALGCQSWYNPEDRGCEQRAIRRHFMVESWHQGFVTIFQDLEQIYGGEMPLAVPMGFDGTSGSFIRKTAMDAAQNATGFALEYFKSYAALGQNVLQYFDNTSVVNSSDLLQCSQGFWSNNATMYNYWRHSGDDDGVVIENYSYKAFCADGHFWQAPSCRAVGAECAVYITGGSGWELEQMLQRSAVFLMPLGIGIASSWANFLDLPRRHRTLTYAWTPDDSFLSLNLQEIIYPPYNAYAWSLGDVTSQAQKIPLAVMASYDLEFLAPDVMEFFKKVSFDIGTIYEMMAEQTASGASPHEVACEWLKSNELRWRPWIPDPTACKRGFGLYDEAIDEFVGSRDKASTCKACVPGTYASLLVDGDGRTYVCLPCPAGTEQPAAGELTCQSCPAGKFKAQESREECIPCERSFYQDQVGAKACKLCPEGTTTLLQGANRLSQCVCAAGSIDTSDSQDAQTCEPCMEGLSCPEGSTLALLKSGQNVSGVDTLPAIESGYFSWADQPMEVFKCRGDHCPGGVPGTCEGGALGPTCDTCPAEQYWANEKCSECEVSLKSVWVVLPIAFIPALVLLYYKTETHYKASASLAQCGSLSIELMLNFVQNLGVLGLVFVPWPVSLTQAFEFSQVFVLNLKSFGFNCTSGGDFEQYIVTAALCFSVAVLLPGLGCLTHAVPCLKTRNLSWRTYRVACATGQIYQGLFVTMCSVGLSPFMCYNHPNGQQSLLKYPNLLCHTSNHGIMQLLGVAILVLCLTHFVLCFWATSSAPSWSMTSPDRLQCIGFLMTNFRPSCWWFGLVVLIRGPLLSLGQVVEPDDEGVQLLVMMCVLLASLCLQLWFLPWKLPLLNLVDAISTAFFLALLAVAMQVSTIRSSMFLDAFGSMLFYTSLAIIAAVGFFSLGLVALQRLCRKRSGGLPLRVVILGQQPQPDEMLSNLLEMATQLQSNSTILQQKLARKMTNVLSVYDLYTVERALEILAVDCELLPDGIGSKARRIRAKRISQMTRKSLATHQLEQQNDPEDHLNADLRSDGTSSSLSI